MSIEDEIVEFASVVQKERDRKGSEAKTMQKCLNILAKNDEDDVLARSFLIGIEACRRWYSVTRGEFEMVKSSRKFKAKGSKAHLEAEERYAELKEENLDRLENLLVLGYMANTDEKRFWVHRIRPLSPAIAYCLKKEYDVKEGQTAEEGIYKLLHRRVTRFRKTNQAEESGATFLRKIHSSLHRKDR